MTWLIHIVLQVALAGDDCHSDGYIPSKEFSEYVFSNTYSALNNLVLRKDEAVAKTCKSQKDKTESAVTILNPIDYALSTRDFDFLLRLGRGIQPAKVNTADIHRLKCKRASNIENGVCLFSEENTIKSWSEASGLLRHSSGVELSTLNCDTESILKGDHVKNDKEEKKTGPDEAQLEMVKQYYIHIVSLLLSVCFAAVKEM